MANKHYGLPYQGSKDKIAPIIIDFLPKGKRLVDLFGGGFAISHCAIESRKWESVYYNDFNPLLVPLIRKAIEGEYNYKVFKPEWISREKFNELKDKDGYVKYCWSFSNGGTQYMFGKDIEPWKKMCHNLVVFGKAQPELEKRFKGIHGAVNKYTQITQRRMALKNYVKQFLKNDRQLERLQRLEQLQQLERLERLELNTGDYKDYQYQDGDVVYLDPPYEGTADYGDVFNHQEFYEWVATRDYPVYFSSYAISDKRFEPVYFISKRNLMKGAKSGKLMSRETIYYNGK